MREIERPEWATDTVLDLLLAIWRENRHTELAPILADALQDTGWDESDGPDISRVFFLLRRFPACVAAAATMRELAVQAGVIVEGTGELPRCRMVDPRDSTLEPVSQEAGQ